MAKSNYVKVSRGNVFGVGRTKTDAKKDLEKKIEFLCMTETIIEVRFGLVIVVTPTTAGIPGYRIISQNDLNRHGDQLSLSSIGGKSMMSELMRARWAAAQAAWTVDMPADQDEAFIAKTGLDDATKYSDADVENELRNWIKWQRSYAKLISDGKTPAEAHQMATAA